MNCFQNLLMREWTFPTLDRNFKSTVNTAPPSFFTVWKWLEVRDWFSLSFLTRIKGRSLKSYNTAVRSVKTHSGLDLGPKDLKFFLWRHLSSSSCWKEIHFTFLLVWTRERIQDWRCTLVQMYKPLFEDRKHILSWVNNFQIITFKSFQSILRKVF